MVRLCADCCQFCLIRSKADVRTELSMNRARAVHKVLAVFHVVMGSYPYFHKRNYLPYGGFPSIRSFKS